MRMSSDYIPTLVDDGHLGDQVRDVKLPEAGAEALHRLRTARQLVGQTHQLPLDAGVARPAGDGEKTVRRSLGSWSVKVGIKSGFPTKTEADSRVAALMTRAAPVSHWL